MYTSSHVGKLATFKRVYYEWSEREYLYVTEHDMTVPDIVVRLTKNTILNTKCSTTATGVVDAVVAE